MKLDTFLACALLFVSTNALPTIAPANENCGNGIFCSPSQTCMSNATAIGAGLVTVAGGEALDEAVKQQTGEGIVPKLRQFIGTEERTGATAKPKPARPYVTPRIVPTKPRNPVIQEAQNRFGLAKERFNPAKGEFGLSELLFGR